jgi:hypothetical protein
MHATLELLLVAKGNYFTNTYITHAISLLKMHFFASQNMYTVYYNTCSHLNYNIQSQIVSPSLEKLSVFVF